MTSTPLSVTTYVVDDAVTPDADTVAAPTPSMVASAIERCTSCPPGGRYDASARMHGE